MLESKESEEAFHLLQSRQPTDKKPLGRKQAKGESGMTKRPT
jgi:hypothetical protein